MRLKKLLILFLALTMLLIGCGKGPDLTPFTPQLKNVTSNTLKVEKIDGLAPDFVMGMDASSVISLLNSGVRFFDQENNYPQDVFKILADNGVNTIRVRVWVNPFDNQKRGYGGGNCDINTAIEIGSLANKYGMNLMVDFHYSDFWADPGKQKAPLAWQNLKTLDLSEKNSKTAALYNYTVNCLQKLRSKGIRINIIQIGNETNGSFCGENTWNKMSILFNAGAKAVREIYPEAMVAMHFTNPEKAGLFDEYAKNLKSYNVDYDIFATSYYPYWHGTLDNLNKVLTKVAKTYGKKVMVAETSYCYTTEDSDFFANTISSTENVYAPYPFTIQGQADSVASVIKTIASIPNGIGICYWEGTWISVGGYSYQDNLKKWETYGSGWATSYSKNFDPDDAGKWYGGSAVDNQAMFDKNGKMLESLKVFALVHTGNNPTN